jgi:chloramphenicol O-acetyltransferase type B
LIIQIFPKDKVKIKFSLNIFFNLIRTFYLLNIRFYWVKYNGFVRIMAHTRFAKNRDIVLGNKVQFGKFCSVSSDVHIGNNVLIAGRVCFVGKHDHKTNVPGTTIWDSPRGDDEITIVGNDVWIGHGATIIAGVKIENGVNNSRIFTFNQRRPSL